MQLQNMLMVLALALSTIHSFGQTSFSDSVALGRGIFDKSPKSKDEIEYSSEINGIRLAKKFTLPEKVKSRMVEWDKCEFLLLALSDDTFKDSATCNYFMEIISSAIKITNVVILVNEKNLLSQTELITLLKQKKLPIHANPKDPGKRNVEIVTSKFNSKWIRDYGPSIVYNTKGEICLVDAIYYEKNQYNKNTDDLSSNNRHYDDIISIYLSSYYNTTKNINVNLIKPPIQLWGGDYQTDSKGNVFTSTETLIMNGGVTGEVNKIFRDYYGAKTVTYLHPLPGLTIKHIDMFFKLVNDSTVLLGKYEKQSDADSSVSNLNTYKDFLQDEISRILDIDSILIKNNFPYMNIIRMPMPPILVENKGMDIISKIIDSLNAEYWTLSAEYDSLQTELDSLEIKLNASQINSYLDSLELMIIKETMEEIQEQLDEIPEKIGIYDDLAQDFQKDPTYCSYIFHTFLNSIYINGSGGQLILVPAYKDNLSLEPVVRDIYRAVYPHAGIVFINSDPVISAYGAIHCTTLIFPK